MNLSEYARDTLQFIVFPQLQNTEKVGKGRWKSCCPNHSGSTKTLDICFNPNSQDPLSIKCTRGCSLYALCEALRIDRSLFPGRTFLFIEEQSEWLERHPERLKAWYQEAVRTGRRLNPEEVAEYKSLCLSAARRAA